MRILIVGDSQYADLDSVKEFVKCLPLDTILLVDRTKGVMNVARNQGHFQDLVISDYYSTRWKEDLLRHKHTLVNDADEVYIFSDDLNEISDYLEYAKRTNKLEKVFHSDGTVDYYGTSAVELIDQVEIDNTKYYDEKGY